MILFATQAKTYLDGIEHGFMIGWFGALLVWVIFAIRDKGNT